MMGVFFFIPMLFFDFWYLYRFLFIIILLYFMSFDFNSYFSMISYSLGIDYFSYMLICLTFFISCLMIFSSGLIYFLYGWFFFCLIVFY